VGVAHSFETLAEWSDYWDAQYRQHIEEHGPFVRNTAQAPVDGTGSSFESDIRTAIDEVQVIDTSGDELSSDQVRQLLAGALCADDSQAEEAKEDAEESSSDDDSESHAGDFGSE
jgi:hypothetical protein